MKQLKPLKLRLPCYLTYFLLTIVFYHAFLFLLIIDLYVLIATVIEQIFNAIAELLIPIGIPTKEAKAEIEIHPVTTKAKTRKCLIYFKTYKLFCSLYSSIYFLLFL